MTLRPAGRLPHIDERGLPRGPRLAYPLQTLMLMRFRHQFVPAMHRHYGDVFKLRIAPAGRPVVFVRRPEHVREVFAGDPATFHAGKGNSILGPVMGPHSLLLVDGAEHARARKLLMPPFNGAALHGYRDLVTRIAAAEVERWPAGEPVHTLDRMNAVTLEVILRVVFGVTDESRLSRLRPMVNRTVNVGPVILLGWIYPRLQGHGLWRAYLRNQQALDTILYTEIAERRRATDLADRGDVLSRLLRVGGTEDEPGLSDDELRDQLVTLLLAGHETTASALSWALYELARSPRLLARTQRAVDEDDDTWVEAVLKESMRLHPVIPMVARVLQAPATIAGFDLPAGVTVAPSILLAHASEDNFADHTAFRPERFLEGPVPPNTWIPFGGGVRRCIGAGFSLMEGVAVLRQVIGRLDVTRPDGWGTDRPRVRNITSVPHSGARILPTPRGASR